MNQDNLKQNKEVFIFTGGILTESLLSEINLDDGIKIGVDYGAKWLIDHEIIPDYFIGDFDSVDEIFLEDIKKNYSDKLHISLSEKDETDTELAMRLAVSLTSRQITIIGGIGTRLDHVLGNVHVLLQSEKLNIPSSIIGTKNRIQLILPKQKKKIYKSKYTYVSLLPFSEIVEGITTEGLKYPINNGRMEIGTPYGISNELIESKGTISIEKGILLIIESND